MRSPRLAFRISADLLETFHARCQALDLTPSQGLLAAVRLWVARPPEPVEMVPPPEPAPSRAAQPPSHESTLLEMFAEQGIDLSGISRISRLAP